MKRTLTNEKRPISLLALFVAGGAGFCTMSYEVLWFRVLKYFVDNGIQSFSILLTTFLFGLALGGFVFSRVVDSRKDKFFLLALMQIGIGVLCLASIPIMSETNAMLPTLARIFGNGWGGEIAIRFAAFSLSMLLPTALMGGAFPVFTALYCGKANGLARSIGQIYGVNTIGGVAGSFAAGFVCIPLLGIQTSITVISIASLGMGLACLLFGSAVRLTGRVALCGGAVVVALAVIATTPGQAFVKVYEAKYPPPQNQMLYCKENVNGTTTVFQNSARTGQRFLLIDGTGEVSTDYFSMRAFRFLGLLPALYRPQATSALVVTFGSGIVAGSIAGLPGIEHVDCIEICKEAFGAARYFTPENHDVLHNPKVNFLVNDGRNFVFTTENRYDIISADATHPTSSDSWVLYTEEFYRLCRSKLTDGGIMCQWIPLHGILERDYKILLSTFRAVFPYAVVYYCGGYKNTGHTVLLGSPSPLTIDLAKAQSLLLDTVVRQDCARVNVYTMFDFMNCFIMDQEGIHEFAGNAPVNTDDKPAIMFSKFELQDRPCMDIAAFAKYRRNVWSQLRGMDSGSAARTRSIVDRNFEAMGFSLEGQILEFEEYALRMKQNFDGSRDEILKNLDESKSLFEQAISLYEKAMNLNPDDFHTRQMLSRATDEYRYLNSFLEKMDRP
jgi:spermidine synthase